LAYRLARQGTVGGALVLGQRDLGNLALGEGCDYRQGYENGFLHGIMDFF
jgi:hypothetical protein